MTSEAMLDLNRNQLIGFTDTRGKGWAFRADLQGDEPNTYPGAIPPEDVERRVFNWTAEEAPVEFTVPELLSVDGVTSAQRMLDDTRKVIYKSDTRNVMGVFSEGYQRHQYQDELLGGVYQILGEGLGIGSAGHFEQGGIGYVQVERPETVELADGCQYRPFLLAMSSHNGKRATGFQWVITRVECDNTLAWAASEGGAKYRIKHTRYSKLAIRDAHEALGILDTGTDGFAQEVEDFLSIKVDDKQWQDFLDKFVPIAPDASKRSLTMAQTKIGELNRLYKFDERVAPWKGTAWGVYQAVNTYDQHIGIVRGLGDGNQAQARYDRSLLAVSGGDLDKQVASVRALVAAVTA